MQAVLSDLGHGKFMRLAASIVIGVCILGVSAAVLSALPQSGGVRPFDAGYLEAAIFIDDSAQVFSPLDMKSQQRLAPRAADVGSRFTNTTKLQFRSSCL